MEELVQMVEEPLAQFHLHGINNEMHVGKQSSEMV